MAARKSASRPDPESTASARSSKAAPRASLGRDLLWIVLALIAGALALPPLVWLTGVAVIGPYANGGMWALINDMLMALQTGSRAAWITLLSPAMLMIIWRFALRIARRR